MLNTDTTPLNDITLQVIDKLMLDEKEINSKLTDYERFIYGLSILYDYVDKDARVFPIQYSGSSSFIIQTKCYELNTELEGKLLSLLGFYESVDDGRLEYAFKYKQQWEANL